MESSYWLRSQKTESQQDLSSSSKKKKIIKSTAGGSLDNNPFESLPTEILQKILGYLPVYDRVRVERVCKRWKDLSTERVWRDVQVLYIMIPEFETKYHRFRTSLEKFGEFIRMEDNELFIGIDKLGIIKSLISRAGQYVKKIIFAVDPYDPPTKSVLSIIAAHCHNIECIELDKVEKSAVRVFSRLLRDNEQLRSITYTDADNIIKKLPLRDWKTLDLGSNERNEKNDWNNKLVALIENSPSLEKLCIPHLTMNMVAAIPKCEQLTSLAFFNWMGYNPVMNPLLNRLTHLKLTFRYEMVESTINLLRSCVNLKSLSFTSYYDRLPLQVVQAVLALPKLECLELDTYSITDEILSRLLKFKCFKLNRFFLKCITENGIFEMIMSSECLEKLDISKIDVTTKLFEKIVQNVEERHKVLEIAVSSKIYEETLSICKGSKIHIIHEKLQDELLSILEDF